MAGVGCTGGGGSSSGRAVSGRAGAPGVGDALFPSLGNGGYDVSHYDLTIAYTPETNHLKGTAVITARATQDLSRLNLDFTGLKVRGTAVNGADARFSRQKDELTVTPVRPLRKGRTFKTTVEYDGTPRMIEDADGAVEGWIETDDGSTALGEPTGSMAWFPGNHHPSDKAAYDITVSVPKDEDGDPYDVVANGELKKEEDTGDRVVRHWRSEEPMASYLASVVVGYFDIYKRWTSDDLPVYVAVDPDEDEPAGSDDVRDLVPEITDWASERFGPYPFSSVGAVVDHLPDLGYALETQTKPYFDSAPEDTLLVHELAHQWFGNSVTPREWKDMWLNEGFATYAEWLWQEDHGGRTAQQTFDSFYDGSHRESKHIWDFPPGDPPRSGQVSDPPVYGRGAMTLHKVREEVGDEVFFGILQEWTKKYRHKNADTQDFISLCENRSGADLSGVFKTWLFDKKKPSNP
ncbi:M1 family metallopeptidase [Streptomyces sp. G5(2025)]|uniref:M1 family metallopeptidase n=1 Tax=Streptomyces sp. G5(2025) TaxID=3406628 RepID=UPI003C1BFD5C